MVQELDYLHENIPGPPSPPPFLLRLTLHFKLNVKSSQFIIMFLETNDIILLDSKKMDHFLDLLKT